MHVYIYIRIWISVQEEKRIRRKNVIFGSAGQIVDSVQSVYTCVDIETDVKHSFRCKYRSSTLFCRICKLQALRASRLIIYIYISLYPARHFSFQTRIRKTASSLYFDQRARRSYISLYLFFLTAFTRDTRTVECYYNRWLVLVSFFSVSFIATYHVRTK